MEPDRLVLGREDLDLGVHVAAVLERDDEARVLEVDAADLIVGDEAPAARVERRELEVGQVLPLLGDTPRDVERGLPLVLDDRGERLLPRHRRDERADEVGAARAEALEGAVELDEVVDLLLERVRAADLRLPALGVDRAELLARVLLERLERAVARRLHELEPRDPVGGKAARQKPAEVGSDVLAARGAEHGERELHLERLVREERLERLRREGERLDDDLALVRRRARTSRRGGASAGPSPWSGARRRARGRRGASGRPSPARRRAS